MDHLDFQFFLDGRSGPNSCDSTSVIVSFLALHPNYFVDARRRNHYENCGPCKRNTPELGSIFGQMDAARFESIITILQDPKLLLDPSDDDIDQLIDDMGLLTLVNFAINHHSRPN
jgi:hypothetical protein